MLVLSPEFSVGDSAFAGCDGLLSIFYIGNKAEWESILANVSDGGNGNDRLREANVFFYSENEPETADKGSFWYYNNKGEPRCW